jgi:hypothetical protein
VQYTGPWLIGRLKGAWLRPASPAALVTSAGPRWKMALPLSSRRQQHQRCSARPRRKCSDIADAQAKSRAILTMCKSARGQMLWSAVLLLRRCDSAQWAPAALPKLRLGRAVRTCCNWPSAAGEKRTKEQGANRLRLGIARWSRTASEQCSADASSLVGWQRCVH